MRTLSAAELLEIWEYGHAHSLAEGAMELLSAAQPEASRESLSDVSMGQRTGALLLLRELLFGRQMAAVVACPRCAERLELILDTLELRSRGGENQKSEISLRVGGYDLSFRLPTASQVRAAASQGDLALSRAALLQDCLRSAERDGAALSADQLPPAVVEAVAESMAQADPLADIQIAVTCPACTHHWRAAFDILSFLWSELEVWAWRMLSDVHTLASAYGWGERDILGLSPLRRQFYLEMVGA